jgi:hypothetical protein
MRVDEKDISGLSIMIIIRQLGPRKRDDEAEGLAFR